MGHKLPKFSVMTLKPYGKDMSRKKGGGLLRRIRNLKMTTKSGPHDYYKGNRTGAMGVHTKYGGYLVNWDKVRSYVVPEGLGTFKLTPFVTKRVTPPRGNYGRRKEDHPISGIRYLARWKEENGED